MEIDGAVDAIELKYQTRKLEVKVGDEKFDLASKGADDNLGYDFVSDMVRVERLAAMDSNCTGHAILLSNEAVWNESKKAGEFNKDAFRIHHGRILSGLLSWRKRYESNARAAALDLQGTYTAVWRDYSDLGVKHGEFRYLWLCTSPRIPM